MRDGRPAGPEGHARRPGRGDDDQRGAAGPDRNDARSTGSRSSPQFARAKAEARRPRTRPGRSPTCRPTRTRRPSTAWLETHPKSFRGRQRLAARLVAEREVAARPRRPCSKLKALYPEYVGPENAYVLLAAVYRQTVRRRRRSTRSWRSWRRATATPAPAYLRLMELDEAAGDWEGVARNARRLLAVNPLIPAPHRQLARAAEQLGRPRRGDRRLPRPGPARRDRPGRGPLPPGEAAAPGRQAGRGPPRGPQVAGGGPALPRRAPAPARTDRARQGRDAGHAPAVRAPPISEEAREP